MQDLLRTLASTISNATTLRKEGDGLRKDAAEATAADEAADLRKEALETFRQAADSLANLAKSDLLKAVRLPSFPLTPETQESRLVALLVELHGAAGGLFQRLGERDNALAAYHEGALLETRYRLPSTYNRLNELKIELLGGIKTLAQVTPRLEELVAHIQQSLDNDQKLGDGGWIYADLGDCLALLGRTADAAPAYTTFVTKAGVKLPERSLDVLKDVARALQKSGDADVRRVDDAIAALGARLAAAERNET
jgi:tetratricopeptide (TPR) repeat protein